MYGISGHSWRWDLFWHTLPGQCCTQIPSAPENPLEKLLVKATTEVEFSFDGGTFRQIVSAGFTSRPNSGGHLFRVLLVKVVSGERPLLYTRFVDDTFTILSTKTDAETFCATVNGLHDCRSFTVEHEKDQQLPFMNALVRHNSDHLLRLVYRKPTVTGLYMRWDSFSPTHQKNILIKSLTSRQTKICSPSLLQEEIATFFSFFFFSTMLLALSIFFSYEDLCWAEKVVIWLFLPNQYGVTQSANFVQQRLHHLHSSHSFCNM